MVARLLKYILYAISALPMAIVAACSASSPSLGVGSWKYKPLDRSREKCELDLGLISEMERKSKLHFARKKIFYDGHGRSLKMVEVYCIGENVKMLFDIDGVSDTRAVYIYSMEGKVKGYHLSSSWGG